MFTRLTIVNLIDSGKPDMSLSQRQKRSQWAGGMQPPVNLLLFTGRFKVLV